MKKFFYPLILLVLLFTSCVNYKLATGSENKKTITDIPLRSNTDKVDVYFNKDLPSVPFYKVQVVDVKSDVSVGYDDLLKKLTKHAQDLGMDGILVLDKIVWTEHGNDYFTTGLGNVNYTSGNRDKSLQQLSAIGIKYKTNMAYIDSIVKTSAVDFFSNGKKNSHVLDFDFYGNLKTQANIERQFYDNSIAPYDIIQHVRGGLSNWEYEKNAGWISSFRLTQNDTTWISAIVGPESNATFYKVDYIFRDRVTFKKSKYTLNCLFDKAGKLKEKQLWQKESLVWKEEYEYAGNKMTGYKRFSKTSDKQVLILQSTNTFFSIADLPTAAGNVATIDQ